MSQQNRVRKLINLDINKRNIFQARKWKKCGSSKCWIWYG